MPIKTMPIKMIALSLVVLLAIAGAVAAVPLGGGNDGDNLDPATKEANGYAAHLGVSLEEAQHRFALQKLAGDLNAELTERRAFIESFVKEIVVMPGNALMRYTVPMPDDSCSNRLAASSRAAVSWSWRCRRDRMRGDRASMVNCFVSNAS